MSTRISRSWRGARWACCSAQPGETPPPGISVTYPHETHYPVAVDGADAAAVQAQVRDLERAVA